MAWKNDFTSSSPKPWENSSSSTSRPWENSTSTNKIWENPTRSIAIKKIWVNMTKVNSKSPWLSQIEFSNWFGETFPFLKEYGIPMLQDVNLLPVGSLQPYDVAGAIGALVVSAAIFAGGCTLVVMTMGVAAGPLALTLAGMTLGVGVAGSITAVDGIAKKSFSWEKWGVDVGFAAATSIIAFPTCFFGGQAIAGAIIQSSIKVTEATAKAAAALVTGLAGMGIQEGSYVLKCTVNGQDMSPVALLLNGVGGFGAGLGAGFLGAALLKPSANSMKELAEGVTKGMDVIVDNKIMMRVTKMVQNVIDTSDSPVVSALKDVHKIARSAGRSMAGSNTTKANTWVDELTDGMIDHGVRTK